MNTTTTTTAGTSSTGDAGAGAAAAGTSKPDCLFCKIARGDIPSRKVYEDDDIVAFHDVSPATPVHVLVIPKVHFDNFYDAGVDQQGLLGRLFGRLGDIARSQGLNDGFRTVVNTGRVGRQEVYHLHIHILGGPEPVGGGRLAG